MSYDPDRFLRRYARAALVGVVVIACIAVGAMVAHWLP